jgi:4-hydroxybenzoate polyprenyltransferase
MLAFLKLIRLPNLLIIALTQCLVHYALIDAYAVPTAMGIKGFIILVLSTVSIAAGGYVINDYFDVRVDQINHDKNPIGHGIDRRAAMLWHLGLSFVGVVLGFFLAYRVGMTSLGGIQLICALLLWAYSTNFQRKVLWGNMIISFLTAMVVLSVGLFEIVPVIDMQNAANLKNLFLVIAGYAFFAFLATLIREIVKDAEDYTGDKEMGYDTLPIHIGIPRTKSVLILGSIILLLSILFFTYKILLDQPLHLAYVVLTLILPNVLLIYQLSTASSKKDFHRASTLIKVIMLCGILSMAVFQWLSSYSATLV